MFHHHQLGEPDGATLKTVTKLKKIPGLILYPLKSHLEKYRLHKQRTGNIDLQIGEALEIQIEVQRNLHEQLEVQRHIELQEEALTKYLQALLGKAQESLGRQNLGTIGLEADKLQFLELQRKVFAPCVNYSSLEELSDSMDSCLTSLKLTEEMLHQNELKWREDGEDDKLDWNSHNENDAASSCKQLHLKGLIEGLFGFRPGK